MSGLPPIASVVPHSGRMLLLDEVVAFDGSRVVCRVRLRPGSTFMEAGRVRAIVALEYMAQAVAAFAGLRARAAGEAVRVGFLLGTRELRLEVEGFQAGDELVVEATHVWGDEELGSFDCAVRQAERQVASATLNVYQGRTEGLPE
ncbi:MAG TPA: 3-hydroxylacyl-ACP dehydratase [Anaeromyxobacteraceae bacterium]|nr:3-hydroxylacyl-ACP dehydratase [Anaeromyxobacteraceae bacterium]